MTKKSSKESNKEKFTLYLDKTLRDSYKEFCQLRGYIPSRMIEIFIEQELQKAREDAKKRVK
ncbi:hypothetical protein HYU06_00605 [Candidatus Woesearchaeota archaeon]|nr:hypothetical protein [Candidatus Woesearchaeota archaeon]